jgi:membrane protease YdiL (CAAX protease family)
LWFLEKRHLWTAGLEIGNAFKKYMRGLLVGLLLLAASVGVMVLLGYVKLEPEGVKSVGRSVPGGLGLVFLGWMVQGAGEELVTRGFLMPIVGIRFGTWAGVLVSSALFALLHLLNPNLNIIGMINLFLFGLLAALYALREGGLWGVFALHSAWNWAEGNLFGLEVSGGAVESQLLIDLTETGPDWITGGAFGPEGGLVVTAVLVAAIVVVWRCGV